MALIQREEEDEDEEEEGGGGRDPRAERAKVLSSHRTWNCRAKDRQSAGVFARFRRTRSAFSNDENRALRPAAGPY